MKFLATQVVANAGFKLAIDASQALFRTMYVLISIGSFRCPMSLIAKSACLNILDRGASNLRFLFQIASRFSPKGNRFFRELKKKAFLSDSDYSLRNRSDKISWTGKTLAFLFPSP